MSERRPVPLEQAFDRHRVELLGFLRRRAPADAEELAQEVWWRVAKAAPDLSDEAAVRGYVFTVARRVLVDHYRKSSSRPRLVPLDGVDRADGSDPLATLSAADVLETVEGELGRMKPEIADVFRLRTTEDASFQDIARRQGTGLNTALGRMHRATLRIAKALADRGLLPPADGEDG